jgi:hypothetical protein
MSDTKSPEQLYAQLPETVLPSDFPVYDQPKRNHGGEHSPRKKSKKNHDKHESKKDKHHDKHESKKDKHRDHNHDKKDKHDGRKDKDRDSRGNPRSSKESRNYQQFSSPERDEDIEGDDLSDEEIDDEDDPDDQEYGAQVEEAVPPDNDFLIAWKGEARPIFDETEPRSVSVLNGPTKFRGTIKSPVPIPFEKIEPSAAEEVRAKIGKKTKFTFELWDAKVRSQYIE